MSEDEVEDEVAWLRDENLMLRELVRDLKSKIAIVAEALAKLKEMDLD